MKKYSMLLSFLFMAIVAIAQQPGIKKIDIAGEHAKVTALMSKLTTAFKSQDVNTLVSLLAEDVLVLGSDPSELFNRQQTVEMWKEVLAQPFEFDFIGEPTIKVAPDGSSAFAVQQYFMPAYSDKIQFRNTYHWIMMNNEWKIFTINTACVPKNEDLLKMNESLNKM